MLPAESHNRLFVCHRQACCVACSCARDTIWDITCRVAPECMEYAIKVIHTLLDDDQTTSLRNGCMSCTGHAVERSRIGSSSITQLSKDMLR